MLIIRKEQMDVLGAYMRGQFEKRMVVHIRSTFSDRTQRVPDDKIRSMVQYGIRKAESYGIEFEDDIRRFLEYLVIYGSRLDSNAHTEWIGEILRRKDINGTAKMNLIDKRELEVLREQTWPA